MKRVQGRITCEKRSNKISFTIDYVCFRYSNTFTKMDGLDKCCIFTYIIEFFTSNI